MSFCILGCLSKIGRCSTPNLTAIWNSLKARFSHNHQNRAPRDPDPSENQAKFAILMNDSMSNSDFTVLMCLEACHHVSYLHFIIIWFSLNFKISILSKFSSKNPDFKGVTSISGVFWLFWPQFRISNYFLLNFLHFHHFKYQGSMRIGFISN